MEQHSRHLLFIHKEFPFGGAERVTLDIANYLCAHGWEVTVATSVHHVDDYPVGVRPLFHVVLLPHGNVKFAPRVACFLRHYIQQHDVCAFVSYRELLYANWLKRQTGAAFVFALQSMPFYEMSHAGWLSRWFYLQKYRRVYRAADAYGVLCEGHRSRLRAVLQQDADTDKLYVLPNSVQAVDHIVWKKQPTKMSQTTITGYQIQASLTKDFSTIAAKATVKGAAQSSGKLTGLKAKKVYYVRIRTYKTIGKNTYYSGWKVFEKTVKAK